MTAPAPDHVIVAVNGLRFGGWKSVRITAGIESIRDFVVEVTDRWPDDTGRAGELAGRIQPGDRVEVWIGDDLVLTGHVDATPREYDAAGYMFAVQGRSLAADLIDSSADNPAGQWKNARPEQIVTDLAGRYGVRVRREAETGAAIAEHQIQPGESAWESIDRVAKARQFLVTDDARGTVVLASPGSGGRAESALELGVNILSGFCGLDFSQTFAEYVVRGQRKGSDEVFGTEINEAEGKAAGKTRIITAEAEARAANNTLRRRRVLIIRQQGQADNGVCADRAAYESRNRAAKALETRYQVAGWRQESGGLWAPNTTARVIDPFIGHDGDMLIAEVTYFLDRQGQRCEIVVVPPDAFLTSPEEREQAEQAERPEKAKAAKKQKKAEEASALPPGVTWIDP
jgi:prophage tail gpP-like protein